MADYIAESGTEAGNSLEHQHDLYITSGGKVGIGTTGPTVDLEICDSATPSLVLRKSGNAGYGKITSCGGGESNDLRFCTDGDNERMRINTGGCVGIGCTNPDEKVKIDGGENDTKFEIEGSKNLGIRLDGNDTTNHSSWIIQNFQYSPGSANGRLRFYNEDDGVGEVMCISKNGNVGIGVTNPGVKLAVNGIIEAQTDVKIGDLTVPDYVFEQGYNLRSLSDVKNFIEKHKHLPDVPSAADYKADGGVKIGKLNELLMRKIEELTLYILGQENRIKELEMKIA